MEYRELPKKPCRVCLENKFLFEFYKKGLRVLDKCKKCMKKNLNKKEIEKIRENTVEPLVSSWYMKPRRRRKF